MTRFRLNSTPAVHTPGVIVWALSGYVFEKDQPMLLNVIAAAFPAISRDILHRLLLGDIPFTITDETLEFEA